MRNVLIALTLLLPASAMGAELQCERWVNGKLMDSAAIQLEGAELSITTSRPSFRDPSVRNETVEQIEHHSVEHSDGSSGDLISVAMVRQPSAGPTGPLEFSPTVWFVDWGAAKATWIYNVGEGQVEVVPFDICKSLG